MPAILTGTLESVTARRKRGPPERVSVTTALPGATERPAASVSGHYGRQLGRRHTIGRNRTAPLAGAPWIAGHSRTPARWRAFGAGVMVR